MLIVVPDDAPRDMRRNRLAYEKLWGMRAATDILVCKQSYFESRQSVINSVPAAVKREGKLLYAA